MVRLVMLVLCFAVVTLAAGVATANVADAYSAELKSSNVPGWSESYEYAWGQATLIRERDTGAIHLTLNFWGLETPHLQTALLRAGEGDPGVLLLELPAGSMLALSVADHPLIADALANDELVIQISDERYPDGAIRGTFAYQTVDIDHATWSSVKDLFN